MNYHTFTDSPTGKLLLTSDGNSLTGLYFQKTEAEYLIMINDSSENSALAVFEQQKSNCGNTSQASEQILICHSI